MAGWRDLERPVRSNFQFIIFNIIFLILCLLQIKILQALHLNIMKSWCSLSLHLQFGLKVLYSEKCRWIFKNLKLPFSLLPSHRSVIIEEAFSTKIDLPFHDLVMVRGGLPPKEKSGQKKITSDHCLCLPRYLFSILWRPVTSLSFYQQPFCQIFHEKIWWKAVALY